MTVSSVRHASSVPDIFTPTSYVSSLREDRVTAGDAVPALPNMQPERESKSFACISCVTVCTAAQRRDPNARGPPDVVARGQPDRAGYPAGPRHSRGSTRSAPRQQRE